MHGDHVFQSWKFNGLTFCCCLLALLQVVAMAVLPCTLNKRILVWIIHRFPPSVDILKTNASIVVIVYDFNENKTILDFFFFEIDWERKAEESATRFAKGGTWTLQFSFQEDKCSFMTWELKHYLSTTREPDWFHGTTTLAEKCNLICLFGTKTYCNKNTWIQTRFFDCQRLFGHQ